MANAVLEKDLAIQFPHFTLLKASAGSGKTYSLTERFVQFLLSGKIPQNHLRNILAITFSNNAAKEMKERILSWLKDIYFKDPEKIEELSEIVSLKKEYLPDKAGAMIDEILKNYTEFQVKTIDSFMTSIYKASAIDLGYSPDFDIVMAPENIMAYAFNRFLRGVREKTPEAEFLEKLLEIILESRGGESAYLWDPSKDFLEETVELYHQLSGIVKEAKIIDAEKKIESIKKEIREYGGEPEWFNRKIGSHKKQRKFILQNFGDCKRQSTFLISLIKVFQTSPSPNLKKKKRWPGMKKYRNSGTSSAIK